MRQQVTVLSVQNGMARVMHKRPTACHGDCEKCAGGCGSTAATETLIVEAENQIGAKPGDRVVIEGETGKVAWAMFLVYILPLVLFFVFYFLAPSMQTACAIVGFLVGIAIAVIVSRRQAKAGKQIRFRIVAFLS